MDSCVPLGQARSRRQALGSLVGAVAALALGTRGAGAQDEECKANGKECKKDSQCCTGNCVGATGKTRGTCEPVQTCLGIGEPCPVECYPNGAFAVPCDACCGRECFNNDPIVGDCGLNSPTPCC